MIEAPGHFPSPPSDLGTCANCKFRVNKLRAEFVVTKENPSQPIPVDMFRQMGQLIPPGSQKVWVAPCAFLPAWAHVMDDAWCWQWKYDGVSEG